MLCTRSYQTHSLFMALGPFAFLPAVAGAGTAGGSTPHGRHLTQTCPTTNCRTSSACGSCQFAAAGGLCGGTGSCCARDQICCNRVCPAGKRSNTDSTSHCRCPPSSNVRVRMDIQPSSRHIIGTEVEYTGKALRHEQHPRAVTCLLYVSPWT